MEEIKIEQIGENWNWKVKYNGKLYGNYHKKYDGITEEDMEMTSNREWIDTLNRIKKFETL
jgi:hypothetical protein